MKKVCKICQKKKKIEKGYVCFTCKRESKPSYWKQKADEWFSKWVRKSNADWRGYVSCITCGSVMLWQEIQNGHYESRGTHILRYDERNGHPQCYACNCLKKGNMPKYTIFMLNKYGQEIFYEFDELSKKTIQRGIKEYKEIADKYKKKFEELE